MRTLKRISNDLQVNADRGITLRICWLSASRFYQLRIIVRDDVDRGSSNKTSLESLRGESPAMKRIDRGVINHS